jgi:hypothetical protein
MRGLETSTMRRIAFAKIGGIVTAITTIDDDQP